MVSPLWMNGVMEHSMLNLITIILHSTEHQLCSAWLPTWGDAAPPTLHLAISENAQVSAQAQCLCSCCTCCKVVSLVSFPFHQLGHAGK